MKDLTQAGNFSSHLDQEKGFFEQWFDKSSFEAGREDARGERIINN